MALTLPNMQSQAEKPLSINLTRKSAFSSGGSDAFEK
jgi:hypothetical protein